jgi:hypothetical protein
MVTEAGPELTVTGKPGLVCGGESTGPESGGSPRAGGAVAGAGAPADSPGG